MALPANTFTTFAAVGNREDLSDEIYMISPTDTPFMTMAAREKASAVFHEWQTDSLASVDTANANLQGDDAVTDSTSPTVRLGNYTQISDKVPRVTNTQIAVEHAGRDDEMDYQVMKKGKELKRDMESILVGTNQSRVAGNSTTAPKLASILSWIKTNTDKTGSDPATADGTATRTDGTQRAFTEAMLKNVIKSAYDSGGEPSIIMLGSFNKQAFSTFTGRSTPTEDAKSRTIVAAVDYYDSDFGKMKVVPNRFMRARDCLVLQSDMWAVAYLPGRQFMSQDLAVTGDSRRKQLLSEYTLVARNEAASGGVFDLTTS